MAALAVLLVSLVTAVRDAQVWLGTTGRWPAWWPGPARSPWAVAIQGAIAVAVPAAAGLVA